jgi:hypothetical protein
MFLVALNPFLVRYRTLEQFLLDLWSKQVALALPNFLSVRQAPRRWNLLGEQRQ